MSAAEVAHRCGHAFTCKLPSEQSSSTIQVSQRRDAPPRVKPLLARTELPPSAAALLHATVTGRERHGRRPGSQARKPRPTQGCD